MIWRAAKVYNYSCKKRSSTDKWVLSQAHHTLTKHFFNCFMLVELFLTLMLPFK